MWISLSLSFQRFVVLLTSVSLCLLLNLGKFQTFFSLKQVFSLLSLLLLGFQSHNLPLEMAHGPALQSKKLTARSVSHCKRRASQLRRAPHPSTPRASGRLTKWLLGLWHQFLLAQLLQNPPAMQETLVRFLGREDPLEKG